MLDEKGAPGSVERAFILPPHGQIGPVDKEKRQQAIHQSVIYGHYENMVDRESAYEMLKNRAEQAAKNIPRPTTATSGDQKAGRQTDSLMEAMAKSAARAIGSRVGREIIRGVLGSIFGGGRR